MSFMLFMSFISLVAFKLVVSFFGRSVIMYSVVIIRLVIEVAYCRVERVILVGFRIFMSIMLSYFSVVAL